MLYSIGKVIIPVFNKLFFKMEAVGQENVPSEGRVILCANHLHAYDPVALASFVKRPVIYLSKKELFDNPFVRFVLTDLGAIPVDREKVAMSTFKQVIKVLNEDKMLGIFPEGTRVKNREDSHPHEGFVMFALKTKSPIVPVHIDGEYGFRKKIKLTFGRPIYLDEYYEKRIRSEQMAEISQKIMDTIYQL